MIEIGAKQSSDDTRTELWLCVERVINGATRRYVEVLQPFFEPLDANAPTAEGAWFLDCAVQSSGAAAQTITGLGHLEGQRVGVFANGQQFADRTVSAGAITIERAMTNVLVGLPIKAEIVSLPFDTQTQAGTTRGTTKAAARVHLHTHESAGGALSANSGRATTLTTTAGLPFGTPLALQSGIRRVTIEPTSDLDLTLTLTCADALPFTLLSWLPDIDIKDP